MSARNLQSATRNISSARAWLKDHPENFPVASLLLPAEIRAPVLALYLFARHADEIADDPLLPEENKRAKLEQLEDALRRQRRENLPDWALEFFDYARATPSLQGHARDLLSAFLQDTRKRRYRDLAELLNYCQRSAAPIGRSILDIAGETTADIDAADALCAALQLLNHLQDGSRDFLLLDRIYLPQDWLSEHGANTSDFESSRMSPPLRKVYNLLLDHCDELIAQASRLPATVRLPRLRLEIRFIHNLAATLCARLRTRDPLAERVTLPLWRIALCFLQTLHREHASSKGSKHGKCEAERISWGPHS